MLQIEGVMLGREGRKIAWLLVILICSVYALTFRGLFFSIDELALFSLTESLVQTHSIQTPQLGFARYHNIVGRVEPFLSLLAAPLYWLAVHCRWLGNIQTVMALNLLTTAMTAAVLYALLLAGGHSTGGAVWAALCYGLATIAWPYSRTFFREPLLALLLTVSVLGFVRWRQTRRVIWLVLTLVGLVLSLFTKITSALAWPALALAFLFEAGVSRRARRRRLLVLVIIGCLGLGLIVAAFALRRGTSAVNVVERFVKQQGVAQMPYRLFGLTFGAGRGLFFFSPILLLVFPGWRRLWRKRRTEAVLTLSLFVMYSLGYSIYDNWHGGLVWGSRFFAPIIPLLFLPVAQALCPPGRAGRALVGALILVSAAIQVVAATSDTSYVVGATDWRNLFAYARSPLVQQFLRWRPAHFDMLWWHGPVAVHLKQIYVNGWIPVLPAIGAAGAAAALVSSLRKKRAAARLGGALTLILVVGVVVLLWQAPTAVAGYPGINPAELRQVADVVNRGQGERRVIVTVSNDVHLDALLSYFKGSFTHYWVSPVQTRDLAVLPQILSEKATRLSLIVDRVHIPPEYSGREMELALNAHLHRYFVDWVGGGYEVYHYLYPPDEMPLTLVDYRWQAGMAMSAWGLTPRRVRAGEAVWLEFHCTAMHDIEQRYDIFVQFLSPEGVYVNGTDGAPQFGAAMTNWWQPAETVIDRRAFFVPPDAPPGVYRVIAGFYRGEERQTVFDGQGNELGAYIELGEIRVQE